MADGREKAYFWVTWLTKLLVGEASCQWAVWFKANHLANSYNQVPSDFDSAKWHINHTNLLEKQIKRLDKGGASLFLEKQNAFTLEGRTAILGGRPDLITISDGTGTILDVKTGQPSPAHDVQVMIYMYAIPRALPQFQGINFDGVIVYSDYEKRIPATSVDANFIDNLGSMITRLASTTAPSRVPSKLECGFCSITKSDCPDRIEKTDQSERNTTDDF